MPPYRTIPSNEEPIFGVVKLKDAPNQHRNWNYFDRKDYMASWQLVFNERIVPIVGLKWGTRLALSQVEGVARFSSGISPKIGVGLIHELALQSALSNWKMLRISWEHCIFPLLNLTTPSLFTDKWFSTPNQSDTIVNTTDQEPIEARE